MGVKCSVRTSTIQPISCRVRGVKLNSGNVFKKAIYIKVIKVTFLKTAFSRGDDDNWNIIVCGAQLSDSSLVAQVQSLACLVPAATRGIMQQPWWTTWSCVFAKISDSRICIGWTNIVYPYYPRKKICAHSKTLTLSPLCKTFSFGLVSHSKIALSIQTWFF